MFDILRALEPNFEDPIYNLSNNIKKIWKLYFYELTKDESDIYDKLLLAETWLICIRSKPRRTFRRRTFPEGT